jgi:hypothetical protein
MKLVAGLLLVFLVATLKDAPHDIDNALLARMKVLYGPEAPSTVTFFGSSEELPQKYHNSASTIDDSSHAGDLASGVVIQELDGQLYLDVRPCTGKLVVFTKPYRKKMIGVITCGGKLNEKYLIEGGFR